MVGYSSGSWIAQAESDLEVARLLLKERRFDWASYAAAQAAEKAIKSLLIEWGIDLANGEQGKPWKIHKHNELFHAFRTLPTNQKLAEALASLPVHDQAARYPDQKTDTPPRKSYTEQQAVQNVDMAAAVVEFSNKLLPALARVVRDLGKAAATLLPM